MSSPKNTTRMSIKIDPDLLQFFKEYCQDRQDTMSGYIKRHIDQLRREEEAEDIAIFDERIQEPDRPLSDYLAERERAKKVTA